MRLSRQKFGDECFTLSWDASNDTSITACKVFLVPPGSLRRAPGSDSPVEVQNFPMADLSPEGSKYSVKVLDATIKAAMGTRNVDPGQYCFTVVAVNNVGNSAHSRNICLN